MHAQDHVAIIARLVFGHSATRVDGVLLIVLKFLLLFIIGGHQIGNVLRLLLLLLGFRLCVRVRAVRHVILVLRQPLLLLLGLVKAHLVVLLVIVVILLGVRIGIVVVVVVVVIVVTTVIVVSRSFAILTTFSGVGFTK